MSNLKRKNPNAENSNTKLQKLLTEENEIYKDVDNVFTALNTVAEKLEDYEMQNELISNYENIKESENFIVFGFFGKISTGKSTLINKLIGIDLLPAEISIIKNDKGWTKYPTICIFNNDENEKLYKIEYVFNDFTKNASEKFPLEIIRERMQSLMKECKNKDLMYIKITIPSTILTNENMFLKNVRIIDTIGVPDPEIEDADRKNSFVILKEDLDCAFIIKNDDLGKIKPEDFAELYKSDIFKLKKNFNRITEDFPKIVSIYSKTEEKRTKYEDDKEKINNFIEKTKKHSKSELSKFLKINETCLTGENQRQAIIVYEGDKLELIKRCDSLVLLNERSGYDEDILKEYSLFKSFKPIVKEVFEYKKRSLFQMFMKKSIAINNHLLNRLNKKPDKNNNRSSNCLFKILTNDLSYTKKKNNIKDELKSIFKDFNQNVKNLKLGCQNQLSSESDSANQNDENDQDVIFLEILNAHDIKKSNFKSDLEKIKNEFLKTFEDIYCNHVKFIISKVNQSYARNINDQIRNLQEKLKSLKFNDSFLYLLVFSLDYFDIINFDINIDSRLEQLDSESDTTVSNLVNCLSDEIFFLGDINENDLELYENIKNVKKIILENNYLVNTYNKDKFGLKIKHPFRSNHPSTNQLPDSLKLDEYNKCTDFKSKFEFIKYHKYISQPDKLRNKLEFCKDWGKSLIKIEHKQLDQTNLTININFDFKINKIFANYDKRLILIRTKELQNKLNNLNDNNQFKDDYEFKNENICLDPIFMFLDNDYVIKRYLNIKKFLENLRNSIQLDNFLTFIFIVKNKSFDSITEQDFLNCIDYKNNQNSLIIVYVENDYQFNNACQEKMMFLLAEHLDLKKFYQINKFINNFYEYSEFTREFDTHNFTAARALSHMSTVLSNGIYNNDLRNKNILVLDKVYLNTVESKFDNCRIIIKEKYDEYKKSIKIFKEKIGKSLFINENLQENLFDLLYYLKSKLESNNDYEDVYKEVLLLIEKIPKKNLIGQIYLTNSKDINKEINSKLNRFEYITHNVSKPNEDNSNQVVLNNLELIKSIHPIQDEDFFKLIKADSNDESDYQENFFFHKILNLISNYKLFYFKHISGSKLFEYDFKLNNWEDFDDEFKKFKTKSYINLPRKYQKWIDDCLDNKETIEKTVETKIFNLLEETFTNKLNYVFKQTVQEDIHILIDKQIKINIEVKTNNSINKVIDFLETPIKESNKKLLNQLTKNINEKKTDYGILTSFKRSWLMKKTNENEFKISPQIDQNDFLNLVNFSINHIK